MSPSTERILVELEDVSDALLDARFVLDFLLANVVNDDTLEQVMTIKGLVVMSAKTCEQLVSRLKHDDQDAA